MHLCNVGSIRHAGYHADLRKVHKKFPPEIFLSLVHCSGEKFSDSEVHVHPCGYIC